MHTCLAILRVVWHHKVIIRLRLERWIKSIKGLQFFAHSWRNFDITSPHIGLITQKYHHIWRKFVNYVKKNKKLRLYRRKSVKEEGQETPCFPPIRPHYSSSLLHIQAWNILHSLPLWLKTLSCLDQRLITFIYTLQDLNHASYFHKRIFHKTFSK